MAKNCENGVVGRVFLYIAQALLSSVIICESDLYSAPFMHHRDPCCQSQSFLLHIRAPFCPFRTWPCSHFNSWHWIFELYSTPIMCRPCSYSQQSLLCTQAQLCSFHVFHSPFSQSQQSSTSIWALVCSFSLIAHNVLSLLAVLIANLSSILLLLWIPQTFLPLSAVVTVYPSPVLLILITITHTLFSPLMVEIASLSSLSLFLSLHRPWSHF